MACWHRSVLVGAELDKVTLPDGTFNRLALKLAMKDLWLKMMFSFSTTWRMR